MTLKKRFSNLKYTEISYNEKGILIRGELIESTNPRMSFIYALVEFENEESNTFESMPNGTRIQLDTEIGNHVKYGCNCTIGGSGFGYEPDENGIPKRMPHLGKTTIGENVEIGSNVCIDRAVIGSTVIGDNVKIDNLVHIAHGAKIGENTLIVAGSVIGGSCDIGKNCFIGMNASIKNKIKIGDGCTIGAGAVVLKDVPAGETWVGNPAKQLIKKLGFPTDLVDAITKSAMNYIRESNAKEALMSVNDDLASK